MTTNKKHCYRASETPARQKAIRYTETPSTLAATSDTDIHHQEASLHAEHPFTLAVTSNADIHHQEANHQVEPRSIRKHACQKVFGFFGKIVIIILALTVMSNPLELIAPNPVACPVLEALCDDEEQKETHIYIDININMGGKYTKASGREFQEDFSAAKPSVRERIPHRTGSDHIFVLPDSTADEGSHDPDGCGEDTPATVPGVPLSDMPVHSGGHKPAVPARDSPRSSPVRQGIVGSGRIRVYEIAVGSCQPAVAPSPSGKSP